jgi:tRNA pseudouridine55 synthase
MSFEGMININKPEGITSFDVVSKLRRLFKIRRIGHCGTLDPFAEGVLPVCIGRATLAVAYMDSYDKKYRVGIAFGAQTDTQDRTGNIISLTPLSEEVLKKIKNDGYREYYRCAGEMTLCTEQIPPMYSAVKVNGRPLYRYARRGIEISRTPRPIKIYEFNTVSIQSEGQLKATVDVFCSKGTYIRTLCADLGEKMQCGAYAESLVRTACGPFLIENSISLEELETLLNDSNLPSSQLFEVSPAIVPTEFALSHLPSLYVSKKDALCLIHGQQVLIKDSVSGKGVFTLFDEESVLIGIVRLVETDEYPFTAKIKAERILINVNEYQ